MAVRPEILIRGREVRVDTRAAPPPIFDNKTRLRLTGNLTGIFGTTFTFVRNLVTKQGTKVINNVALSI